MLNSLLSIRSRHTWGRLTVIKTPKCVEYSAPLVSWLGSATSRLSPSPTLLKAQVVLRRDPDDPDRRLLLHVKNNISRSPQGLAFRLEQRLVGSDEKGDIVGSCIAWEDDPVEKTADEALHSDGNKEQTARADATEFLSNLLGDGPLRVTEIEKEAQAACLLGPDQKIGQSKPFRSARRVLNIVPYQRKGEKAGGWFWALPIHSPTGAAQVGTSDAC